MIPLTRASSFVVPLCLALLARAQDGMPSPAPELQKLAPFVGHWTGSGTMTEPAGVVTRWTAIGSYAWCLGGHFLQKDFQITFAGMAAPLVFRGYLGWDRENRRYVDATVDNGGQVRMQEMRLLPDGSQLEMTVQDQEGMPYAERSLSKVEGDAMTHTIDMLMPSGASLTIVDGKFTRGGKPFEGAFDGPTWMGARAHESFAKLTRSAGVYDVQGEMVMMPGQPATKIAGTDTFRTVFGGTVLHGRTEGEAAGMPGKYLGEVFWGHDAKRGCVVGIYVSNMGEVMQMDARWSPDGKLVSTSSALFQGQPAVQRMVMEYDATGAAKSAVNHSIVGTEPPFESFRATYAKRK